MIAINIKPALKDSRFWLLANAVGICAYLLIELWIMAPRSEAESLNFINIIYYWTISEFPLLVVFLILNVIWLIFIVRSRLSNGSRRSLLTVWFLVCLVWGVALFSYGLAGGMVKILIILTQKGSLPQTSKIVR
jgi:hypothetical protein